MVKEKVENVFCYFKVHQSVINTVKKKIYIYIYIYILIVSKKCELSVHTNTLDQQYSKCVYNQCFNFHQSIVRGVFPYVHNYLTSKV